MKSFGQLLTAVSVFVFGLVCGEAGTISYVAIPATQSDSNSGISRDHGYTSAVDGGNTTGTDRVVNGITFTALSGAGQSTATADNCTFNALSGTLTDAGVPSKNPQADGTMRELLSGTVFNNAGGDNSQVEIVLDPESLEQGSTYDLRVYISSSSGQNRQVNLAFFGDGQNAAETGFFNEDDARTSAGGFSSAGQTYYINYRFTWDGDSTPGVTITQKSGGAPFCLYALTNELVTEGGATASANNAEAGAGAFANQQPGGGQGGGGQQPGGGQGAGGGQQASAGQAGGGQQQGEGEGGEGGEGLSSGYVEQGDDQVGVTSESFYGSDSLNSNGSWVSVGKWGKCWQPTNVSTGWSPYTNGTFQGSDSCGWTFCSDEPWAWACYHYGRWCKVNTGCGWAWVPGKVWAGSWVSWRQGDSCGCIGWAPLPPETGCQWNVGVSSWVDYSCGIGPSCYTFVNIRDFGASSYSGCGCIYPPSRNSTCITQTTNCTNISHGRGGTYCGGPDFKKTNETIRSQGGKECGKVYVNRYDRPDKMGGKTSSRQGNQMGFLSPKVKNDKNPQHDPKVAGKVKSSDIDHGWKGVDPKEKSNLKNTIAQQNQGKNSRNTKATLPSDAAQAQTMMKKQGGKGLAGQAAGGQGQRTGNKGVGAESLRGGGQAGTGGFNQHPGGRGKAQGVAAGGGAGTAGAGGFNQHPGKNRGQQQGRNAGKGQGQFAAGGGQQGTNAQGRGGAASHHPGQSLKKSKVAQTGAATTGTQGAGAGKGAMGQGGTGKQKGKNLQAGGQATAQGGATTSGQGAAGQAGKRKGKGTQGGGQATGTGGGQGGRGAKGQQQGQAFKGARAGSTGQQHQAQNRGAGQGGQAGGGGGGGHGRSSGIHQQQQKQQQQQQQQQQLRQRQQQQQQQQQQLRQRQQQQQQRQQQQQGGRRRRATPTPAPR